MFDSEPHVESVLRHLAGLGLNLLDARDVLHQADLRLQREESLAARAVRLSDIIHEGGPS